MLLPLMRLTNMATFNKTEYLATLSGKLPNARVRETPKLTADQKTTIKGLLAIMDIQKPTMGQTWSPKTTEVQGESN